MPHRCPALLAECGPSPTRVSMPSNSGALLPHSVAMLSVLYGALSHLARTSMCYLPVSPFHPIASWCYDIVSWVFLALSFAFFASFADQKLYASPVGFMVRSEEHTSELQSLMRISYAVFCLKKK